MGLDKNTPTSFIENKRQGNGLNSIRISFRWQRMGDTVEVGCYDNGKIIAIMMLV